MRHSDWFRWLKILTVMLGAISAAVFGIWLAEHRFEAFSETDG